MKMRYFLIVGLLLVLFVQRTVAQDSKSACIDEVIALENEVYSTKFAEGNKAAFIHYKVKSEDWDGEIIQAEVKMYRNASKMHFFSDQVDIYTDKTETFLVLKPQKLIMATTTNEDKSNALLTDDFLKFRNKFLKYCEVQYCSVVDSINGIKQLKLKVKEDLEGIIDIETMTYKYDTKNKKVLSTTVVYSSSYKLKKMTINYIKFSGSLTYTFLKSKSYILSSKGKLLDKFKNYEFIDDRINKKNNN